MPIHPTVVVGNWKMHKTIADALSFVNELIPLVGDVGADIWLAAPFTCLSAVAEELSDTNKISVGAQNISHHEDGPWTGEVSARMVKEAGADLVILGHSERRHHYAEGNSIVNMKVKLANLAQLRPIVCVGETLQERSSGVERIVVGKQLRESLAGIAREEVAGLMVAYEPVWAIGTGKNAEPSDAQQMHQYIRQELEAIWGSEISARMPILYGGSVKPENAQQLLAQRDVDGLLVGGASLNAHTFSQIINATINHQVA